MYQHRPEDDKPERPMTLVERLEAEAERETQRADQFRGCSFVGEWPGSSHLARAALLRQAAAIVAQKTARKRRKT
jgi:hypothetical protein